MSPTVLAIDVSAADVVLGSQVPYQPAPGDVHEQQGPQVHVKRGGRFIGRLVGKAQDILFTYDQTASQPLEVDAAVVAGSYALVSADDASYTSPQQPTHVDIKSKPSAMAQGKDYRQWPASHTLFLHLPQPLQAEQRYQLDFPGLDFDTAEFIYSPTEFRSEAVHVSQLGFRPDDNHKVGYLSMWMGTGGSLDYPEGLGFQLVDQATNEAVYTGTAKLHYDQNRPEDPKGRNYTLTEVHQLDFSDFNQQGNYRLCVDGVGCSFDFEIGSDVWQKAFETSARGFYHQRSGIAIGAPYSQFERPRAFHPDDGVTIYHSNAKLEDVDMGLGELEAFSTLLSERTEEVVPDAWGGYFDAGDWDRRIQHLKISRGLLELHNLFPNHFKAVNLNIPESGNALPDILDEALWTLDFFRRLQTPEGGIRGGVESAEHPLDGEGSWQESQLVMAYAPDVWSSYTYAGVAARAAHTLKAYDAELAKVYEESAIQAMSYAETHYSREHYLEGQRHHVNDQRNLAALELYRLTEASRWHDLFLATTMFQQADAEPYVYDSHEQRDAAFLYAWLNTPAASGGAANAKPLAVDAAIQKNARAAFLTHVDQLVTVTETTAFGWSKDHPASPLGWANGLGAPQPRLLQAHALTGDQKYLEAGLSGTQFSVGANPENMVYTTGLGQRSPQNPLIFDHRVTGQAPPPGITLYGPADLHFYGDFWTVGEFAPETTPPPWEWPSVESYFDVYLFPVVNEFTVDYMLNATYTWGYLAAR